MEQRAHLEPVGTVPGVRGFAIEELVAEADPLCSRRRPPGDRAEPRVQSRAFRHDVTRAACNVGRPLEVGLALARTSEHEASHRDPRVCASEGREIARALQ